jgi:hypothetical protein
MYCYSDNTVLFLDPYTVDKLKFNDYVEKSRRFASASLQSKTYYKNERRALKAHHDIVIGKVGEFIVAEYLEKKLGYPSAAPDLTVLPVGKKSWSCDLPYPKSTFPGIHIKTCSKSTLIYTGNDNPSWTYQKSNLHNKYGEDSLFKNKELEALTAFIYVHDLLCNEVFILGLMPWLAVQPLLTDPIKANLVGLKKCIYATDIIDKYKKIRIKI